MAISNEYPVVDIRSLHDKLCGTRTINDECMTKNDSKMSENAFNYMIGGDSIMLSKEEQRMAGVGVLGGNTARRPMGENAVGWVDTETILRNRAENVLLCDHQQNRPVCYPKGTTYRSEKHPAAVLNQHLTDLPERSFFELDKNFILQPK